VAIQPAKSTSPADYEHTISACWISVLVAHVLSARERGHGHCKVNATKRKSLTSLMTLYGQPS